MIVTVNNEKLLIYSCYAQGHNPRMTWGENKIGKAKKDAEKMDERDSQEKCHGRFSTDW